MSSGNIECSMNIGDIVKLKSGSPNMTVCCYTYEKLVPCRWFDGGELKTAAFLVDTLDKVL